MKSKDGKFIAGIDNIFGTGYEDQIENIIHNILSPGNFSKEQGGPDIFESIVDFYFTKDNYQFLLHLGDSGPTHLKLLSPQTNQAENKTSEYATLISEAFSNLIP